MKLGHKKGNERERERVREEEKEVGEEKKLVVS